MVFDDEGRTGICIANRLNASGRRSQARYFQFEEPTVIGDTMSEQLALAGTDLKHSETVEEFRFDDLPPIKGVPSLRWAGKRPFTSTKFYPAQKKETYGQPVDGWMNKIFWGDNLQVMSHLLKDHRSKIDLIYIDPPFDSRIDYHKTITVKGRRVDGAPSAFEEKQYGDIWVDDEYLQYMYERLVILRELLSEKGTLWLHCDIHKSHHLRFLLDEIFGSDRFISEIIWKRAAARGNVKMGFSTAHDTIYCYARGSAPHWTPPRLEYSEEYIARFNQDDGDGRKYTLDNMINPNPDRPNLRYEWNGVTRVWRVTKDKMQKLFDAGLIAYTSSGVARYKRYMDELEGQPLTTIWDDIQPVNSQAEERENYPTQKPEALISRIIETASPPNGLVFDAFMGSGTTQAAAMKLGRRFLGSDINLGAIQTSSTRLIKVGECLSQETGRESNYPGFAVYNVNNYDVFRNPIEAKELLRDALEVQPLAGSTIFDGVKDGFMVKIMPVNRIATRADLNDIIAGMDFKQYEKRRDESPGRPVEKFLLVCMGHEPDLAASLVQEAKPFLIEVKVVDILRDRDDIQFKRSAEAKGVIREGKLVVEKFYPLNLMQKLSYQEDSIEDWRQLVDSIKIDWNYDGAVLEPALIDMPEGESLVSGVYDVPADAGTVRVKITDLLSESLELTVSAEE